MAGRLSFQIDLYTDRPELIPETAERVKDLRPAFESIIREWAKDNRDKFDASEGTEGGGAAVDPEVFWDQLTPNYMKSKRRAGFPDHLMVRTGQLMDALTNPDRFFQQESEIEATFGTPLDPDDLAKAGYNWKKRQTIFLSVDDQRMIDKRVSDFLSLGPGFEEIMFARGLANLAKREASAKMDVDFGDTVQ